MLDGMPDISPSKYLLKTANKNVIINPYRFVTGGGGSPDGYPVLEGSATTSITSATTSHTVNLPSGIAAGELLLIIIRTGGTNINFSVPSGWSQCPWVELDANGTTSAFFKTASGSEGSTVSITTSGSRKSSAIAIRVSSWLALEDAGMANTTTSNNPPNLAPTWGSAKTLWIACVTQRGDGVFGAAPSNYTGMIQATAGDATTAGSRCAFAFRKLEASSEDPGRFNVVDDASHSNTFAIRPA